MYRLYVREFGAEAAKFYATEHGLEIPDMFNSDTSSSSDHTPKRLEVETAE
jgi:hypothetical protein